MSITVTLVLEDGQERAGFERLMRDIDSYRQSKYAAMTAGAPGFPPPADEPAVIDAEFAPVAQDAPAEVVGEIIPKVEVGNVPSEDQLMAAVRNFLRKNQLPKTLETLKKFGVTKATDPMTDEVKVALFAELTK